jgi:RNA recognition motif-containing protein
MVKEDALKTLFSEFGQVLSVKIIGDKYTGESKGFGFVEMVDENQGMDAITKLTNVEFFGRKLVVAKAKPRTTTY